MRSLMLALSFATALVAAPAHASIAVADSNAAFWATDAAQKALTDMEKTLKPQSDRLKVLATEIEEMNKRLTADSKVLAPAELQRLQNQAQAKINEYNSTAEGVQKRFTEMQSSLQQALKPKMEKVIDELMKEGKYEMIIEKKNTILHTPEVDLTKKITERMNLAK